MTQKLDVTIVRADGTQAALINQSSSSAALWNRLRKAAHTARSISISRHDVAPPPVVVPPAFGDLSVVRSVLILAEDPMPALDAPPWYRFWITADLGYRDWYSDGTFIQEAKDQGREIRSWCDCKADHYTPGVGTGPADAKQMAADYVLDGWALEGESPEAFQRGYDAGGRVGVVNMSALTQKQVDLIATAEVRVTSELYRNLQPGMQPNWRNANKGVGSDCIAVYGSTDEGATPTPESSYAAAGYLPRGVSVYCGGDPKPNYKALP